MMLWSNRRSEGYAPPSRFREWASRLFGANIMLSVYSPEWDHFVRVALSLGMVKVCYHSREPDPEWVSNCTVMIGEHEVWVGNYPYQYGVPFPRDVRPSYATIKLLKKHVDRVIHEAGGVN